MGRPSIHARGWPSSLARARAQRFVGTVRPKRALGRLTRCARFLRRIPKMTTLHGSHAPVSLIHVRDGALPVPLFRRIRSKVRSLGGERIRSTYQTTFWFAFGRADSVVEEAVLSLRRLLPSQSIAGVEWWLSRMRTNRVGVDFHQDRDERLAMRRRRVRHPRFSSVLFLNRVRGGALAVTLQSPDGGNPSCVPLPLEADLVAPRANRLVWFEGNLTHGVLDADNQVPNDKKRGVGELRLSVVLNWWSQPPSGIPTFSEAGVYAPLRRKSHTRRVGTVARHRK
jgi:hypothetical protein